MVPGLGSLVVVALAEILHRSLVADAVRNIPASGLLVQTRLSMYILMAIQGHRLIQLRDDSSPWLLG